MATVTDGVKAATGGPAAARHAAARPVAASRRDAIPVRVLRTVLLLLLVIFGLRAMPSLGWKSGWHGPFHDQGIAITIGLEAVLAVLLGYLVRLRKRRPDPSWLAGRIRAGLATLIPGVMVLCGIALLQFKLQPHHLRTAHRTGPQAPPRQLTATGPHRGLSPGIATAIEYTALAMIIISLVIVLLTGLVRLRRGIVRRERLSVSTDETDVVREAVEAGRTALTGVSDARMAIIACYLAMERSLDGAGATRGAAETADELLARARDAGLLHGAAPAELTALFLEARFSRHDVPDSARARALGALDVILADIGVRPAGGTEPRPGGAAVPS